MNWIHHWCCKSDRWRSAVENEILPWTLDGISLLDPVLEVGPGPGVTTEWLRHRIDQLECLEVDPSLADSLQRRFQATNVSVRCGDAAAMPYENCSFSSVVAFTMLHHIPTPKLQDQFFHEAYRVLRPGGIFAGVDSLPSLLMSIFHIRDTLVLVSPDSLVQRLKDAGFSHAQVEVGSGRFRFSARRSVDNVPKVLEHSFISSAS